jgi:hypothetical protein
VSATALPDQLMRDWPRSATRGHRQERRCERAVEDATFDLLVGEKDTCGVVGLPLGCFLYLSFLFHLQLSGRLRLRRAITIVVNERDSRQSVVMFGTPLGHTLARSTKVGSGLIN